MSAAFRALPDIDIDDVHAPFDLGPQEVRHGVLANGITYYVRPCKKPAQRAAIALAVRVGSVLETEQERGVAHILEHLAFNATKKFENHQLIAFLESIGAEFGACSNAYTSADETVYEVMVPTDDPKFLRQALEIFAQFASHIRCSPEDLAKERGAVMEEWRMGRNSRGRAQEAQWKLMLQGSQYADRLPIGLESVIKNVSADTVRAFYDRWYRPENMCVAICGDFDDCDAVVDLVRELMEPCAARGPPIESPRFPLVPHMLPRFSAFADSEAMQTLVYVTYKQDRKKMVCAEDTVQFLAEELFQSAFNERLFKLSRQESPPFYIAQMGSEPLTSTIQCKTLSAQPREGKQHSIVALQTLLTEMARVRCHGFSHTELDIARAKMLSDIESAYLERDQTYATDMRDEYVRHFLHGEFVVGAEAEARLSKTLLSRVTPEHLQQIAQSCCPHNSCVVKTVGHESWENEAELEAVLRGVDDAESAGELGPWPFEDAPAHLIEKLPPPGTIVSRVRLPEIGATELVLSNGMKVTFKETDFLKDQVLLSGFASGGLSEVPENSFRSASFANMVAGELGMFGLRPEVLSDVLAGKRASVVTNESAYWRLFGGDQSPEDLETALQLVHRLFTTQVEAVESRLETCKQLARESVVAKMRDPMTTWGQRVKFLNYGGCYYFKPMTLADVDDMDPQAACAHFTQAYQNPAEWHIVLTGAVEESALLPLLETLLASIPAQETPTPMSPLNTTPLPFTFPLLPVREDVRVAMVAEQTQTQITFPVEVDRSRGAGEIVWLSLVGKLLETRLLQLLRFKSGDVYTISVTSFFGAEAPSTTGNVRGDVAVGFSCEPRNASRLVDLALDEIDRLQAEGPTQDEVDTVKTLVRRAMETELQENSFWHEQITGGYRSRYFRELGNLDAVYKQFSAARDGVLSKASPQGAQDAFRRLLPQPSRQRFTAVTMVPATTLWQRTLMAASDYGMSMSAMSPRTALLAATAAVATSVATFAVVRAWRKGPRG